MPTPTYEPIQNYTLGSDTSTILFSSIPQTYNHLVLVMYARSTRTYAFDVTYLRLNGDTSTSNYGSVSAYYQSASGTSSGYSMGLGPTNTVYLAEGIPAANAVAGQYGLVRIDIPAYRNATFKSGTAILFGETTAASVLSVGAFKYENTSAITSLQVECTNQYVAGSQFTLYGVI